MAKDFLTDENGDIYIDPQTGDFAFGHSDDQIIEDVIFAHPGEYKQTPYIGVGIEDYLNSPLSPSIRQELERKIKLNLEADGAQNIFVKAETFEDIVVTAQYKPYE